MRWLFIKHLAAKIYTTHRGISTSGAFIGSSRGKVTGFGMSSLVDVAYNGTQQESRFFCNFACRFLLTNNIKITLMAALFEWKLT